MYNFTTENVTLNIIGSHSVSPASGKCTIKWFLELDYNTDCIRGLTVIIPKQTINTSVIGYNSITDEEFEEDIAINIPNTRIDNIDLYGDEYKPRTIKVDGKLISVEFENM